MRPQSNVFYASSATNKYWLHFVGIKFVFLSGVGDGLAAILSSVLTLFSCFSVRNCRQNKILILNTFNVFTSLYSWCISVVVWVILSIFELNQCNGVRLKKILAPFLEIFIFPESTSKEQELQKKNWNPKRWEMKEMNTKKRNLSQESEEEIEVNDEMEDMKQVSKFIITKKTKQDTLGNQKVFKVYLILHTTSKLY